MECPANDKFIFISYSHKNSNRVLKYLHKLNEDNVSMWYDEEIHYSVWSSSIENALEKSSAVVLFVTPEALSSNNVFNEISFADNAKKNIFCVYLTDTNIADYSGWRLMLTKCQAFFAYKDGDELTYERLKKCLIEVLKSDTKQNINHSQKNNLDNNVSYSKDERKIEARILCIRKKFDDAKKIYDDFIAKNVLDMDGYMGYIRIASENYKKFDGKDIDETIQIAKDISGEDDLSQFDNEYQRYFEKRKNYFAKLAEEKKKIENEKYNVGNIVTYGKYWKDQDRSKGKTLIEWIVLKRENDKVLLLSKYCLDCKQYSTEYSDVTWETSSLRKWLNQKFISDAFSVDEQEKIILKKIENTDNPEYETNGGNVTEDKIFLLSIDEAETLLNKEERQAKCTEYAKAQGVWVDEIIETPYWWLRSPGGDNLLAAAVHYRGKVFIGGLNILVADTAVRPAFWLNIQ